LYLLTKVGNEYFEKVVMGIFNELYAEQYDSLYGSKDYKIECDLIEEAVRRFSTPKPISVLDVGCGTGEHAIEMARRGYVVTGVDLSQQMLDVATVKTAKQPYLERPRWVCGDLRDFKTAEQYDMAIMMFSVVGYLTSNNDVLAGLRNIRRHIKLGSLLICDFWSGPSVLTVLPGERVRVVQTQDGKIIRTASTALNIEKHTADVTFKMWTLAHDILVSETCETHHLRYFFPMEIQLFLSNAGFNLKGLSAFPSLDVPLTSESWNALAVAVAV